jgi:hypothetical protein
MAAETFFGLRDAETQRTSENEREEFVGGVET